MPDTPDTPHRHGEDEDAHFHDDEEVAQPPADEDQPHRIPRPTQRPARQLPPPKRRFHEE